MEQNILIAVGVFSIICVICVATICLSLVKQNEKLKERVSNEKNPMYNIWHRALSNNLQKIPDNQHGKEIKGKKCPCDFDSHKDELNEIINEIKAKEKKYVEKIRQLEKILVAEEIQLSVDGQVTNMKADKLKYEKYELNLEKSHLQNDVERLNSLLGITERRYVNLLDFVIYKHKNDIPTVDIDLKKTREKIEKLIEESNKKSK